MSDRLRPFRCFTALAAIALLGLSSTALAAGDGMVTITDRMIDVSGTLSVSAAQKIAGKLHKYDQEVTAPIMLTISATRGSAQGVMLVRDSIQQLKSPVVGLVITQVHGAGAAVAMFTDQVVVYPSAGFVFTDVEYEGVTKPKPKPKAKPDAKSKPDAPTAEQKLLQQARTAYLGAFWASLARRVNMKPAALQAKIKAGGFIVTAAQALKQKIAHRRADRIRYVKLNKKKETYKVTSSTTKTRAATPLFDGTVKTKK